MCRRVLPLLALAALAALPAPASAANVGACGAAHVTVRHATVVQARNATLCLLNQVRSRAGLRPLRLNGKLARAARRHSRDMVRHRYFAHDSRSGATPFQRVLRTRYVPRNASWWIGENLGWGGANLAEPAALVRAWMRSPAHRANILSRHFREVGIGIALGVPVRGARYPGATYTTDFGSHS